MPINNDSINRGQFSTWHMERAQGNKYSESDSSVKPEAGERSKTLHTDGRPAGTHFDKNSWFDGGPGNRGARAQDLAKFSGQSFAKQSDNDAPFMRGDRARTADGTLRVVRGDQTVSNNATLSARAPDLMAEYGDMSIDQLRDVFNGLSVSKIGEMTQAERGEYISLSSKQSENDAPFMRGDRARTEDGTLREVRGDQMVSNNPTLAARAPELMADFGDKSVDDLRDAFGGMSVSQIGEMTQAERADLLAANVLAPTINASPGNDDFKAPEGGITSQIAQLRSCDI